jgi:putative addiction module antidote
MTAAKTAAARRPSSAAPLKLRPNGNSASVILPKAMLKRYGLGLGDTVHAVETADGILLSPYDPLFEEVLASNRDYMKRHRNALRELSKR